MHAKGSSTYLRTAKTEICESVHSAYLMPIVMHGVFKQKTLQTDLSFCCLHMSYALFRVAQLMKGYDAGPCAAVSTWGILEHLYLYSNILGNKFHFLTA